MKGSEVSAKLTPETDGILWLTPGPIEEGLDSFFALDYFLSGLLTEHVHQQSSKTPKASSHFFGTTHFSKPFYCLQYQLEETDGLAQAESIINLLRPLWKKLGDFFPKTSKYQDNFGRKIVLLNETHHSNKLIITGLENAIEHLKITSWENNDPLLAYQTH